MNVSVVQETTIQDVAVMKRATSSRPNIPSQEVRANEVDFRS